MKWFGTSWNAPVNEFAEHTNTPTGDCAICEYPILPTDSGFILPYLGEDGAISPLPYHRECFLLDVLGPRRMPHKGL